MSKAGIVPCGHVKRAAERIEYTGLGCSAGAKVFAALTGKWNFLKHRNHPLTAYTHEAKGNGATCSLNASAMHARLLI
jgi:hypothetical protein